MALKQDSALSEFLKDIKLISSMKKSKKYDDLTLPEYPFDAELLNASPLYRQSREDYLELGGQFRARMISVPRSLSSHDLFSDVIEYSPVLSEMEWFIKNHEETADAEFACESLLSYSGISIYHEQNHRILWRFLPPAPTEQRALSRYLNFAEALVVMLDLALADQIGKKLSLPLERTKTIYRTTNAAARTGKTTKQYHQYLMAIFFASYLLLEGAYREDIPNAVDYIFPKNKTQNKDAVKRSLDISELFINVTNAEWQSRNWKKASEALIQFHNQNPEPTFYISEDPLDFENEFQIVHSILNHFAL
jgi:hypothetical protein